MTPNLCQDSMEAALWNGWCTLKDYLSNMEDHLQKVTERFESSVNEKKRTLTPERFNEFTIDHVEEYIFYDDEFSYILRNSFLVSAYSMFEDDINKICRKLKDTKQIPIKLSDLGVNLLEQAKKYCKLAGFDITKNLAWQEIDYYRRVRNCIVHRNGLLKVNKDLIEYVKKKCLIKERVIIIDDTAEPEVGLTKLFCEEVIDTMQKFIDALYKNSIKKQEK
jgi:hypothetical protein